jgi:hypothetical protein
MHYQLASVIRLERPAICHPNNCPLIKIFSDTQVVMNIPDNISGKGKWLQLE